MARALKEHGFDMENQEIDTKIELTKKTETEKGTVIEKTYIDLKELDNFKPYNTTEPLPDPVIEKNRRGILYCRQPGEARYFFRGNDLMKVWREIGKRTSIVITLKPNNPAHQKIRKYLIKRGIRGE